MKFLTFILLLVTNIGICQTDTTNKLKIETYYSIDQIIDKILVGNGIRIGNIKIVGSKNSIGYFAIDSSSIGLKRGLVITTGDVVNVVGPNNSPGTTSINDTEGDTDLNRIIKGKSQDAVVIEFDFVPFHNRLSFDYCFGSEEYKEYVGSSFNDGFAFLISGHGYKKKNIAVIPGTNTPVTINNVNHKRGIKYYINNDYWQNVPLNKKIPFEFDLYMPWYNKLWYWITFKNPYRYAKVIQAKLAVSKATISEKEKSKISPLLYSNFEYDGFTSVLKAECFLKPFKKYHIKIVIGDVGDGAYDSGVFIGEKSFQSYKDTSQPKFVNYKDISNTINWDSLFYGVKKIEQKKLEPEFPYKVYFGINEFTIPEESKNDLKIIADYLKRNPGYKCQLIGYTDNTGSLSYNEKLAKKRVLSVLYCLKQQGVNKVQLILSAKNYEQPISEIITKEEQQLNRRVEINLLK